MKNILSDNKDYYIKISQARFDYERFFFAAIREIGSDNTQFT